MPRRYWATLSVRRREAIDRLDREGYVLFQGEYWQAEAEDTVEKGEMVVITGKGWGQAEGETTVRLEKNYSEEV